MKRILFIAFMCPILCIAQTGNIAGNVFWKYNEFVGNRGDAGAEVYLWSQDTSKQPVKTTCDITGNFSLSNLDTGTYLLGVVSKNTNSRDNFNDLDAAPLKEYFGFDLKNLNPMLYDSVDFFQKEYLKTLYKVDFSTGKEKRQAEKNLVPALKKRQDYEGKLLSEAHLSRGLFGLFFSLNKINLQEITIKANQTTNVVIDFGITDF
ncbi:MAG TPA: hypothetical protein VHA74_00260 [Candidatus Dojkabacteria bacterium]|nr:hypothetical protein [Candidatus Dojkabacteria bacterium]